MDIEEFWRMMKATHAASDGKTQKQVRLLIENLAALGPDSVLAFEDHLDRLVGQAYDRHRSPGSAFYRADGFTSDGLEYFSYAIVAAGEEVYYKILGASYCHEIESVRDTLDSGESLWLVPMYAYYRATGLPHPQFCESDYDEDSEYLVIEDAPTPASPVYDTAAA